MPLPVLKFRRPIYKVGMNYTVRKGTKWNKLHVNEAVFLEETDCDSPSRLAVIRSVIRCPMWNIPIEVYRHEHDPACRTVNGLMRRMKEIYGRNEMSSTTIVTCIGFELNQQ